MRKILLIIFLCLVQICFGQTSDFSFKLKSVTDFYDSQTHIFVRKYENEEVTLMVTLTNSELKLIKDYFDEVDFLKLPMNLECNNSIDILPVVKNWIFFQEKNQRNLCFNQINCEKNDKRQEKDFENLWNFIFSILENKINIKELKKSNFEVI